MKIVVLEALGVEKKQMDAMRLLFETEGAHELVCFEERTENQNELAERAKGADVVVLTNIPLTKEFFVQCPDLKYVAIAFTGFDHVDIQYCRENNILVSNAAGFSDIAVAELSIALMLDVLRKITELHIRNLQLGTRNGFLGGELNGKTIGIIGTGRIGSKTAEILKAFGCKLLGYSRSGKSYSGENYIQQVSKEDLLRNSDIVSLHIPLNESTLHFIGESELQLMKKDAVLINTARGKVIDNYALANALNLGEIAGAGIDVYDSEPPLDMDQPLFGAENVVLTPHIAYATKEAMLRRLEITNENIRLWMKGKPQNVVS
ncbi:MAG: NAD(P)-dependent oxidoreductase [Bacteroidales bacterium]